MQGVFSTYVEVILGSFTLEDLMNSILHVCGGDPMQDIPNNLKTGILTYVEVILLSIGVGETVTGILHACGGDPAINWSR